MPAIYAHRMFGERVVSGLSRARFFEIFQYPEAYALGLHGPDLLFYYRPLYDNDVRRRGEAMHAQSAAPFFTRARHIVRKSDNAAADRAYLYGFACHFCLDSACHPVVDALMRRCSLTHAAVETAFDRTLLLDDGIDPVRADLTGHLRATPAAAAAAAEVCGMTLSQAEHAIRSMRFYSALLRAPGLLKRTIVRGALHILRRGDCLDLMQLPEAPPSYAEAGEALKTRFRDAVPEARRLAEDLRAFFAGEAPLSPRFDGDYNAVVEAGI